MASLTKPQLEALRAAATGKSPWGAAFGAHKGTGGAKARSAAVTCSALRRRGLLDAPAFDWDTATITDAGRAALAKTEGR